MRGLERQIGTIARKFARMVAEEGVERIDRGREAVIEFLGRQKVFRETKRRTSDPGVSTGLAWTPAGGDILFIEARAMPGTGQLVLTGQLGDVMKESAQAALTYVRSIADKLGADAGVLPEARHPRARAGRRGAEGRPLGGRGHDRGAGQHGDRAGRSTPTWR